MASETERATEYRRMMRARVRNKKATERALRGDPARKRTLEANTEALLTGPDADGVPRLGFEDAHR